MYAPVIGGVGGATAGTYVAHKKNPKYSALLATGGAVTGASGLTLATLSFPFSLILVPSFYTTAKYIHRDLQKDDDK